MPVVIPISTAWRQVTPAALLPISDHTQSMILQVLLSTTHTTHFSSKSLHTFESGSQLSKKLYCFKGWHHLSLLSPMVLSTLHKSPSLFYLCRSRGRHSTAAWLSWTGNPHHAQPTTPAMGTVIKSQSSRTRQHNLRPQLSVWIKEVWWTHTSGTT